MTKLTKNELEALRDAYINVPLNKLKGDHGSYGTVARRVLMGKLLKRISK